MRRVVLLCLLAVACGPPMDDDKPWVGDAGGELLGDDTPGTTDPSDTGDTGDGTTIEDAWALDLDDNCSPFAMADDCLTPWPTLFHTTPDATSPTGRRLNYSVDSFVSPDGPLPVDPAMFNQADGVSPVQPLFINLGRDVDPTQLWGPNDTARSLEEAGPIVLVDVETGQRVPILTEMDMNQRDIGYDGRHALIIRPLAPLTTGGRYAVGISNTLHDTAGESFAAPDGFVALRDGILTTDARIEGARERFADVFTALDTAGLTQDSLLVAWEVPVASEQQVLGPIQSMREQAAVLNESGVPYVIESVETDPTEHAWKIVRGTFQPPNFLTEDYELVVEDGEVALQTDTERPSYPFTVFIPAAAADSGASLPLVVVGHGLFGSGESWIDGGTGRAHIQPGLAAAPAVGIATDWIGLSQGDLDLILTEVVPDISRIQLVTDRLGQSLVNNLTLVELAHRELAFDPALGWEGSGTHLDRSQTWYYGGSLGGIQGASFTAVSPDVSRAVLAVPGAGWSTMFQRSIHFSNIELLIDALYPDPLSQSVFLAMLQTFFDRSDPAGLAHDLALDTDKTVLLQEAVGDVQVPNVSTDLLVRSMGAHHLDEAPRRIPGVAVETGPSTGPALTQLVLPDALAAYTPPESNVVPTEENGVHGDGPTTPQAIGQALELLSTGLAVHPCDGPCDPD